MILSRRLHHFAIAVADLEATLAWYCEHLDFTVETRFRLPDAHLDIVKLISPTGVRLELLKSRAPNAATAQNAPRGSEPGSKHVCFEVRDIEQAAEEMRRRGIQLVQSPKVIEESREKNCWITDNEGNMIEFIEDIDTAV